MRVAWLLLLSLSASACALLWSVDDLDYRPAPDEPPGGDGGAGAAGGSGASGPVSQSSAGGGGAAAEDCENGDDDDSDGEVDCADDDCSDYSCFALPQGWQLVEQRADCEEPLDYVSFAGPLTLSCEPIAHLPDAAGYSLCCAVSD